MSSSRGFAAALLLGLIVRIATLPLPGHEDVNAWRIWTYAASRHVTTMYGVGGHPPTRGIVSWGDRQTTVNYPPVFLYEYAVVGRVYRTLFPSFPNTDALLVAIKLPVLAANAAIAWLLWAAVRRVSGRDDVARWAALAVWINPATIAGGEMLGYVDALCFLPATGALVAARFERPAWAGALAAIAVGTKPQGLLIAPALLLALWQEGGARALRLAAAACVVVAGAALLPFAVRGALPNMWLAFESFGPRRDTMSAYGANVWWIVNWWLRSRFSLPELGFPRAFLQPVARPLGITRFRELGYPDPQPIGRAALAVAVLWACWETRRSRTLGMSAALGAFTVHAFFVVSTGIHEHHQLFEVPLLALAAALRPRFRPLFYVVSAIVTLNINYVYGISPGYGWAVPRGVTLLDVGVVLAVANIAALAWFARLLRDEARVAATGVG